MLCPTTASADVIHVACPVLFTAFAAQMVASPSLKSTVPVTIPAPGLVGDTEAVKVTGWPNTDGLADVTIAVVVLALLTFCVTGMRRPKGSGAGAVAGRNALSPSPPYVARSEWLPTPNALVVNVATPPAPTAPVPSVVAPSKNVTAPVGAVPPGTVPITPRMARGRE